MASTPKIPNDGRANGDGKKGEASALSGDHCQPNSHYDTDKKDNRKHWLEYATAGFALIAAVGAISSVIVGLIQYGVYTRQAQIMKSQNTIATAQTYIASRQAEIMDRQNDIAAVAQQAFISTKDVRIDKGSIPSPDGTAALWFYPIIENGGNTAAKNLRMSASAAVDPGRPGTAVVMPMDFGLGGKQSIEVAHWPDAGPPDPESILIEAESLEGQGKPSRLLRTVLGPHVSQSVAGIGVPVEETKRRIINGERWFILGAIHYEDRLPNSGPRLLKYCYVITFHVSESGELKSPVAPCQHWNCTDDDCRSDKAAYDAETKGWTQPPLLRVRLKTVIREQFA
jgi:hypothetical protein